jgi:hypothetical protein
MSSPTGLGISIQKNNAGKVQDFSLTVQNTVSLNWNLPLVLFILALIVRSPVFFYYRDRIKNGPVFCGAKNHHVLQNFDDLLAPLFCKLFINKILDDYANDCGQEPDDG